MHKQSGYMVFAGRIIFTRWLTLSFSLTPPYSAENLAEKPTLAQTQAVPNDHIGAGQNLLDCGADI